MLLCEHYQPASGAIETIAPDAVAPLLAQPDTLVWVDLDTPTEDELAWLAATFQFHPLALEDVRNQRQRAKVDRYPTYFFVVLHTIDFLPGDGQIESREVDLFIGSNYLITSHRGNISVLTQVRQRWEAGRLMHPGPTFLLYLVADGMVDSYFPIIDEIGDEIDDIDNTVFAHADQAVLRRIFELRRSLLGIRKILGPMRDAFNELIRDGEDGDIFTRSEQTRAYFTDVFDHVLRLTDFVDTYRDMLSGSLDAFQSSLANRLNQNMQRLTVAATVLATATLITGFFGMNLHGLFINSPAPYGGQLVLLALLIITFIEIWLFHRKGWL